MKWLDDKPSREFRDRVFAAASNELAKLAQAHTSSRRSWMWQMAGAAGLATVVAVVVKQRIGENSESGQDVASIDPALLQEMPLLEELDLWQNLEMFEKEEDT